MKLTDVIEALRLQRLPCHLSWLEETLKGNLGRRCTLEEKKDFAATKWLQGLSKYSNKNKEVDIESESILDHCSPKNPRYAALFSRNLNQVARAIYGEDLKVAKEKLKQLRSFLPELKGEEHGRLKKPVEYLMGCAQWAIGKLGEGDDVKKPILEMEGLKRKLEVLQTCSKSQAVLKYMETSAKNPRPGDEDFFDLLKVQGLDPTYFIWRHHFYHALKLFRRETDKFAEEVRKVKLFSAPCPNEIDMAQKAYELCAGNPKPEMVVFDMVLMLVECLLLDFYAKMYRDSAEVEVEPCPLTDPLEAKNTLLKLMDELEIIQNPGNVQTRRLKHVARKVEVLLYIESTEESREEGLKLLLDTLDKYPDSGLLWLKMGRLRIYNKNTVPDELEMKDFSRKCFRRAIKLKQGDSYFKSLRGYLNLLPTNPPVPELVEEALGFLTEAEEAANCGLILSDSQAVDVGIWRGCVLWIFTPLEGGVEVNRKEACKSWIKIWMKYPKMRDSIMMNIQNPSFSCNGRSVDMEELTRFLVQLKCGGDLDRKKKKAVTGLLKAVKCRGQPRSAADMDDNWRK